MGKIDELLERPPVQNNKHSVSSNPTKKEVELKHAQLIYEQLETPSFFRLYQNMKCPRNCEGRIKNNGKCTPDNCIVLGGRMEKCKISLAAIKKAENAHQRLRVKHLDRKDIALLDKISTYGKITSNFHYRVRERPEIKKQLESLNGKMPRMKNVERIRLRDINDVRTKLGLKPLADMSHLITGKTRLAK